MGRAKLFVRKIDAELQQRVGSTLRRGRITLVEKMLLDACIMATDPSPAMMKDAKSEINEQLEMLQAAKEVDPSMAIDVGDLHPAIWEFSQMVTRGQRPQ